MTDPESQYIPFRMPVIGIPDVELALCRIERSTERGKRREREQAAVRRLLEYFSFDPLNYRHTPDGAPYIEGSRLHISVSHSLDYAAMTVSHTSGTGVDIEQPRPSQLQRVAQRFLSEEERSIFTTPDVLLWAWTAKEAVYKAARISGLGGPEIALDSAMCTTASARGGIFSLSTLYSHDHCCVVARDMQISQL